MTGRVAVMQGAGVFLTDEAAALLWPYVHKLRGGQSQLNGGPSQVHPVLGAVLDGIRAAALHHGQHQAACPVSGRALRTSADEARPLASHVGGLRTADVARELDISTRHVGRLAAVAGVEPLPGPRTRKLWPPEAVAAMRPHQRGAKTKET